MKVDYQGKQEEAIEVDVVSVHEPWVECQLSNGKLLRFKGVVISVCRLTNVKNPDGSDIYLFGTQRIVNVK
ncbi:MAG: hypothetical protein WC516_07800 [Patescibacteria group bacterium]|jgi:hypothetical protein